MVEYIIEDDFLTSAIKDSADAQGRLEELVRCKYCKHSEEWYGDKRRCFLWHESGIDVFENGYCNYGKRK